MKNIDTFISVGESFTDKLSKKTPDQISAEYSYMTLTEHLSFVSGIFNKLEITLEGEGMEVAAGVSALSCSLARLYPNIKNIYALEIVSGIVEKLQPILINQTNMQGRVIPTIGDFDNIKLPDNSLDFVTGCDSLHHSNDLHKTLAEIGRVLKPGGRLIYFDRAQPDHMTKAQEDFLLNTEYARDFKIQHGIDPDQPYNRSIHGEHEPRIRDWNAAFADSGLHLDSITLFTKRSVWGFLKILAAHIPYFIRAQFKIARNLTAHNKVLLYYILPFSGRYGKLKIFPLHTRFKTPTAPMGKMIFIATKA